MRLIILAMAMLPVAAHAQETTTPAPTEPVAAQSCPAGMTWNTGTQSCGLTSDTAMPAASGKGGHGCSFSAAREVTS